MSEISIISRTVTVFTCPICGTEYRDEARARQCAEYGIELNNFEKNFEPFMWHRLQNKKDRDIQVFVFPFHLERTTRYCDIPRSCLNQIWMINNANERDYYKSDDWTLIATYDMFEGWNRFNLFPNFNNLEKWKKCYAEWLDENKDKIECLKQIVKRQIRKDCGQLSMEELYNDVVDSVFTAINNGGRYNNPLAYKKGCQFDSALKDEACGENYKA